MPNITSSSPRPISPISNDSVKLGDGKEKVERLTNLIAIFESPALDFSKNRAEGDDLLGDAYEYLMRNFATESGKSKGQFYTPAEVSRVIAQILDIRHARTTSATTVYDPTCGSGSLLLKVADEAPTKVTLYGQEKDGPTSGLARMNMILHNNPTALIMQGNTLTDPKYQEGETLTDPKYQEGETLKTFDYVVANPPFSDKRWSTGLDPLNDPYERFKPFGAPPNKQGDYAYLLHIVRSLKSTGQGACILPHGVLFRGNAEGEIRRNLVRRGYIQGIIGLPANLFYGTGIPACIVVLDKEGARALKGIFMVDASGGYMKDGPKNRLRDRDIHRIVDTFRRQVDVPGYAHMASYEEIEANEYNLNLPRYIDTQEPEDLQDIEGHLRGGIPARDVDGLERYWQVYPQLKETLFQGNRPGYYDLVVDKAEIKPTIYEHPEFVAFSQGMDQVFNEWRRRNTAGLKALQAGCKPKEIIAALSEDLLAQYAERPLIDRYAVYQHLMDYWAESMQDDCYLIAAEGWKAETYPILDKKGKQTGWACDLVPKELIVDHYFAEDQAAIDQLNADLEELAGQISELEEEQSGEEGTFGEFEKINKTSVKARLKEIQDEQNTEDEMAVLQAWLDLGDQETDLKKQIKEADEKLDAKAYAQYPKLTPEEVKTLVVDGKWMARLECSIQGELEKISQALTQRVKELADRYMTPLPELSAKVDEVEAKVIGHLEKMGFIWM